MTEDVTEDVIEDVTEDVPADETTIPRPSAEEVRSWAGDRLDEIAGANVGKIDGVFVDADSGEPEWIVARMGRFGHHTLVPARDAVAGIKRVWVPYTRDQIRQAPKADPKAALTAAAERALLAHFGVMADAGRGAVIAARDDADVTAQPA